MQSLSTSSMANRLPHPPTSDETRRQVPFHEHLLPPIRQNTASETYGDVDRYSIHPDSRLTHLYVPQQPNSASSNESASNSGDVYRNYPSELTLQHGGNFGNPILQNPKRAYRQRRKDPSCDACRERKVKCDATETTSCTECSSRNVRCQFTKDSNRRMSSMKQVQDLERQLQDVKQQLEIARASEYAFDQRAPFNTPTEVTVNIPDVSRSPQRMLRAQLPPGISIPHADLVDVGRGLLKPPIVPAVPENPEQQSPPTASLPSRDVAQACLDAYLESVHRRYPILFWPQFCHELWDLYRGDLSLKVPRETVALSFGVLALGALYTQNQSLKTQSESFLAIAYSHLDLWTDKIGMNQGLLSFLISIYMYETNRKSTSWVWLAPAVRIAQDRGFHIQREHWSPVEGEMRKRIWYSLYVWDRTTALEMGRPMLIHDDDFDVKYPDVLEEEAQTSPNMFHPEHPTCLLACVQVARLLQPLAKIGRSLCVDTECVRNFESVLVECVSNFPPHLQLTASGFLDPAVLFPVVFFQNARLSFYRHNLSPACSAEQRTAAIDNCARTAQDTANIISRCLTSSNNTKEMEARIKSTASPPICTHLWRCMLFLAFQDLWSAFALLLHYATVIGDEKAINSNCGRHLTRFLQMLINRHQANVEDAGQPDEEIIAFLSGDLQNGTSSWVWDSIESKTTSGRNQSHCTAMPNESSRENLDLRKESLSWDSTLSEEEVQQWGGWDKVREAAQYLDHLQRQSEKQPQREKALEPATQLVNRSRAEPSSRPDPSANSTKSRMTIASIT